MLDKTARDKLRGRPFWSALWLVGSLACAKADVQGGDVSNGGLTGGGGNGGQTSNVGGYNAGGFGGLKMGMPGMGNGEGDKCDYVKVPYDMLTPTVALLVDRSGSMKDTKYEGDKNRWDVLQSVLLDDNGFIPQVQKDVRFGFATFTSTDQTCPLMTNVDIKLNAYADIKAAYQPLQTPDGKSDTPTPEALNAVAAKLEAFSEPGPKYILLATDGEPDGCTGPRDPNCGQDASITAVQNAFKKGIRTFVIAIGNDVGADHLQALANAGAGLDVYLGKDDNWLQYTCGLPPEKRTGTYVKSSPATNAPTYRPVDGAALARDLRSILGSVRSCSVMAKGKVAPGQASLGSVVLDGSNLTFQSDWKLAGDQQVELLGAACQKLQDGQAHVLEISFPCAAYTPPG